MPQELPGYYYDAEKKRYFKLPPGGRPRPVATSRDSGGQGGASSSGKDQDTASRAKKQRVCNKVGALAGPAGANVWNVCSLVRAREAVGPSGAAQSSRSRQSFGSQVLEAEAQDPQLWRYDTSPDFVPDSALAHVGARIQTAEGLRDMSMLLCGSAAGLLSVAQLERPELPPQQSRLSPPPLFAHPPDGDRSSSSCGCSRPPTVQPSYLHKTFKDSVRDIIPLDPIQGPAGLVNTVIASLDGELAFTNPFSAHGEWGQLPCDRVYFSSIWTARVIPGTSKIALGLAQGKGGRLVLYDRPTRVHNELSWGKSGILSMECESEGGCAIFVGYRNGMISTIDPRSCKPESNGAANLPPPPNFERLNGLGKAPKPKRLASIHQRQKIAPPKLSGPPGPPGPEAYYCSHSPLMWAPSAVASLKLVRNDVYIISSSMNGALLEWDRRLPTHPVRSYEGHFNTHSFLPLALDPTHTLLMSGGEDKRMRIWSLSSGRLLFTSGILPGPVKTLCTPLSPDVQRGGGGMVKAGEWDDWYFRKPKPWGLWMGIDGALWYMSGSALCTG